MTATTVDLNRASDHEIAVVLAYVIASVAALCTRGADSHAIATAFPAWEIDVVYACLALGGLAILAGVAIFARAIRQVPVTLTGLMVERFGLLLSGPIVMGYGAAAFSASGLAGTFAGLIAVAVGIGHLMRAYRITRNVAAFRAIQTKGT